MSIHQQQPVLRAGAPLSAARAAMVMLHGRGASASGMLSLAEELDVPGFAFLAPQAAGSQWYPNRFMAPIGSNEPWFSSALGAVQAVLADVERAGVPPERTLLLGFSQGACLALEFAARHPRRYGGVIGLSGALIENGDQSRDYVGSLGGAPAFLGCSDVDPHIPLARVRRSATVLTALGAAVDARIYPGLGHTVNLDELDAVKAIMGAAAHQPGAKAS